MREILFRGKRVDNGEWVEGFYVFVPEHHNPDLSGKSIIISINNGLYFEVDPETVGQFTGLTDKNGKKIFEGDIMRYGYPLPDDCDLTSDDYLAIFADGAFCGQFIDSPKYTPKIYDICFSSYYIVGNKWDNSELLAGK